jgi:Kef-type K+ transport system membrane component KefB
MLLVGRRLLRVLDRGVDGQGRIAPGTLVAALLVLMLGAFVTDVVGIYAVFGAFIVGVAMPRGRFAEAAIGNLEPITTTFLLPVFFVYSGLNTQIGLLTSPAIWRVAVILVAVAIVGKGVACLLAARVAGEAWRESVAIGVLMNARGLMELIILNIGLQHGIITPTLFTIMVLMAVITTLMTSPLFDLVYGRRGAAAAHQGQAA